jgi:hypothetical protein
LKLNVIRFILFQIFIPCTVAHVYSCLSISRVRFLRFFPGTGDTTFDLVRSFFSLGGGGAGLDGSILFGARTGTSITAAGANTTGVMMTVGSSSKGAAGKGIFGGSPSENGLLLCDSDSSSPDRLRVGVDLPGEGKGKDCLGRRSTGVCGGDGVAVSFVELASEGVLAWSDEDGAEGWGENDRLSCRLCSAREDVEELGWASVWLETGTRGGIDPLSCLDNTGAEDVLEANAFLHISSPLWVVPSKLFDLLLSVRDLPSEVEGDDCGVIRVVESERCTDGLRAGDLRGDRRGVEGLAPKLSKSTSKLRSSSESDRR